MVFTYFNIVIITIKKRIINKKGSYQKAFEKHWFGIFEERKEKKAEKKPLVFISSNFKLKVDYHSVTISNLVFLIDL